MIIWTKRGDKRLWECERYIALQCLDRLTVLNWHNRVLEAVEYLTDFPESGSIVRELHRDDIRQVLVGDYRVIYRVKRRNVEILTVRHTAFLIQSLRSL